MIIGIASLGGGMGKTTTAVHIATYASTRGETVLIDSDPNASAIAWARPGKLPFQVVNEGEGLRAARTAEHLIIDSKARPDKDDFKSIAKGCDLIVLPTIPNSMSIDKMVKTLQVLRTLGVTNYKVLLTIVPPKPSKDSEQARTALTDSNISLFRTDIPRLTAFTRAFDLGVPVYQVPGDPRAPEAWNSYTAVCEEIFV
jgi:chromosome partitioning protein